jgi:hypothetical protein
MPLSKFVNKKPRNSTNLPRTQTKKALRSWARLSYPPSQPYEVPLKPSQTQRSSIKVWQYKTELTLEREARPAQLALASHNLQNIFSTQNISEIAILLLNHFLILRKADLEAWEEDPEEWILEATGDVVSAENGLRVRSFEFNVNDRWLVNRYSWSL